MAYETLVLINSKTKPFDWDVIANLETLNRRTGHIEKVSTIIKKSLQDLWLDSEIYRRSTKSTAMHIRARAESDIVRVLIESGYVKGEVYSRGGICVPDDEMERACRAISEWVTSLLDSGEIITNEKTIEKRVTSLEAQVQELFRMGNIKNHISKHLDEIHQAVVVESWRSFNMSESCNKRPY